MDSDVMNHVQKMQHLSVWVTHVQLQATVSLFQVLPHAGWHWSGMLLLLLQLWQLTFQLPVLKFPILATDDISFANFDNLQFIKHVAIFGNSDSEPILASWSKDALGILLITETRINKCITYILIAEIPVYLCSSPNKQSKFWGVMWLSCP